MRRTGRTSSVPTALISKVKNNMKKVQDQVKAFHKAMGQPAPDRMENRLDDATTVLRSKLIVEEHREVQEALAHGTPADLAKELCDLIYVIVGTAVSHGIDLVPVFDAVHESNMAKVGGPIREDGKRMKPEGWKKPDIKGVLDAQKKKEGLLDTLKEMKPGEFPDYNY